MQGFDSRNAAATYIKEKVARGSQFIVAIEGTDHGDLAITVKVLTWEMSFWVCLMTLLGTLKKMLFSSVP